MTVATAMSPRERWLAAIDRQPVDRIPFWAKVGGLHARRWNIEGDLHEAYASSGPGGAPPCVTMHNPRWQVDHAQADGLRRTVYRAPGGQELVHEYHFDAGSESWHPMTFLCQQEEDIELLTDFFAGLIVERVDETRLADIAARAARSREQTIVNCGVGESPLMEWIEHVAGVEEGHYLLADEPELVEGLFAAKHRVLCERAEILAGSGLYDQLIMTENTSTTLISVDQYQRYCFGHIQDYAEIIRSHDCRIQLHMCGHLKALLPMLAQLPINSFEAFTAPPVGNTRLLDGRQACPDTALVGGTSAALWLRPQREIIDFVLGELDALPHHRGIVLSSAGVMPPVCPPETVRAVSEAVGSVDVRW